ncbi:MAG: AI-2E family transporter, partial [Pseudomonadota bacterium]
MDRSTKVGIWIIATGVIVSFLYLGRALLAPFAMAVFLFLIMEGFAGAIDSRSKLIKRGTARLISILVVTFGFGLYMALLARGVAQFGGQAALYENRINALISDLYSAVQLTNAPTLSDLLFGEPGRRLLATLGSTTGELSEDLILIFLYVGFLFLAQSNWPVKLDLIFRDGHQREQVRRRPDAP